MVRLLNSVIGFALLLYPFAVYFGIQVLEPWKILAVLLAVLLLRFCLFPTERLEGNAFAGLGVLYCVFAIWHNSEISLRLYSVGVYVCLLLLFALSLVSPPSAFERLARFQHPNLSSQSILYTRKVTLVWCIFFTGNGLIAAGTAVWANSFWWGLYNGFIAYLLMGILMGAEYLFRIRTLANEH
jgi:uncharacterized membrane protein